VNHAYEKYRIKKQTTFLAINRIPFKFALKIKKQSNPMKKFCSLLCGGILAILAATGCQQGKRMDNDDIAKRADSVYNAEKIMAMDSMKKDCDTNMGAWVIMKADSIYKADSAAMAMAKK
jgi:hypothetical protein